MTRDIVVLHVDDDPAVLDLTAEFVERANPSIVVRSEGDPHVVPDRLEDEPIDCVVSDYKMPDVSGIDLCRRVRTTNEAIPFILFTSVTDPAIKTLALEMGATDFLQKRVGTEHYSLLANRIELAVTRTSLAKQD